MITLLTDFGSDSFQIVRSRAWLEQHCSGEKVLDISHSIHANDINEAAYVFKLVSGEFAANSIHVIAIDFDQRVKHPQAVYFKYNKQHILTYNSGIASLILEQETSSIHELAVYVGQHYNCLIECFGHYVKLLTKGQVSDQKPMISDHLNIKTVLQPVTKGKSLRGQIMYVDALETCYTNISQNAFDEFIGTRAFDIVLSRHERISTISKALSLNEGGGTFCYFNTAGLLTISVYRGSAKRMYGLNRGQIIIIEQR